MKALLVIDMLNDFINIGGALETGIEGRDIVPFVKDKIEEYREDGDEIIFICDNHEADDQEFDMFAPHCVKATEGAKIIKELEVKDTDKIIFKRRYSAFFGTDLDLTLREKGITEISIVGVCTNICVLYTSADARNIAYDVNVYREGVASFDREAHDFALKEMETTLGCTVI
nr:isochorismatase family cysteine hydrolase [Tissierella sp.]